MGGQSFYLGVLHQLMCHGQLSHTIYAREVSRSCVGCFIVYTVLFRFTTDHYTTSVMCLFFLLNAIWVNESILQHFTEIF